MARYGNAYTTRMVLQFRRESHIQRSLLGEIATRDVSQKQRSKKMTFSGVADEIEIFKLWDLAPRKTLQSRLPRSRRIANQLCRKNKHRKY